MIATIKPVFSDSDNISQKLEGAPAVPWRISPTPSPSHAALLLSSTASDFPKNISDNGNCRSSNILRHLPHLCWESSFLFLNGAKVFPKTKKEAGQDARDTILCNTNEGFFSPRKWAWKHPFNVWRQPASITCKELNLDTSQGCCY